MKSLAFLLAPVLALVCASALAQTQTSSFASTAQVARSCKIVSAPTVEFGTYDSTAAHRTTPLDAVSQVGVVCTTGSTGVGINFNGGENLGAASTQTNPIRRMKSGTNYLNYQIYTAPSYSSVAQTNTSFTMANFTSLDPVYWPIYIRVAAGQSVPAGEYQDTITVTVRF